MSECSERLYAMVLHVQVLLSGLRAPRALCQAGFRPHLTIDHEHQVFALRHLVEDCRRKHLPMCMAESIACFIDFAKARVCGPMGNHV